MYLTRTIQILLIHLLRNNPKLKPCYHLRMPVRPPSLHLVLKLRIFLHKTSAGFSFHKCLQGALLHFFYNIIYQGSIEQVCIICLKSDCTIDWLVHYWSDELQAENDEKIQAPASVVRGRLYYIHCGVTGSKSSGNYQYWDLQYTANIFNVIFTLFTCVPLSTVISLYCLHLIAAPSTVE